MKSAYRIGVPVASVLLLVGLAVSIHAQDHHVVLVPEAKWQPAPPFMPPGAQIAVLEGNPAEKGPITLRLKFPASYQVPPHWHSMTERLTVLSGDFNVGMGDTLSHTSSQPLQPGGFVSLPGKMHHYAWAKSEVVVQISLEGPFDIFYVNPGDDPQKKPAATSQR